MAHIHGTVDVQINEASQPIHNTFPVFFSHARDNVLNRTVIIFLLIRQQLERIDQMFRKPCALNTFASSSFVPSWTILLGALHSYLPPHTTHHQLQCLNFISCHFLVSSAYSFEGPSHPLLRCRGFPHHIGTTSHTFVCSDLLRDLPDRRLLLPLTLSLPLLRGIFPNLLCLCPF